jgi:hypothetical protein
VRGKDKKKRITVRKNGLQKEKIGRKEALVINLGLITF